MIHLYTYRIARNCVGRDGLVVIAAASDHEADKMFREITQAQLDKPQRGIFQVREDFRVFHRDKIVTSNEDQPYETSDTVWVRTCQRSIINTLKPVVLGVSYLMDEMVAKSLSV